MPIYRIIQPSPVTTPPPGEEPTGFAPSVLGGPTTTVPGAPAATTVPPTTEPLFPMPPVLVGTSVPAGAPVATVPPPTTRPASAGPAATVPVVAGTPSSIPIPGATIPIVPAPEPLGPPAPVAPTIIGELARAVAGGLIPGVPGTSGEMTEEELRAASPKVNALYKALEELAAEGRPVGPTDDLRQAVIRAGTEEANRKDALSTAARGAVPWLGLQPKVAIPTELLPGLGSNQQYTNPGTIAGSGGIVAGPSLETLAKGALGPEGSGRENYDAYLAQLASGASLALADEAAARVDAYDADVERLGERLDLEIQKYDLGVEEDRKKEALKTADERAVELASKAEATKRVKVAVSGAQASYGDEYAKFVEDGIRAVVGGEGMPINYGTVLKGSTEWENFVETVLVPRGEDPDKVIGELVRTVNYGSSFEG
jgi:hypothetical protein